jgi:hypothetical protein
MPRRPTRSRPALLTSALLFASLLSCGREITGVDGSGRHAGAIQLDPQFATIRLGGTGEVLSIGSVVDFASIRVLLEREDGTIEVDSEVPFPPTVDEITLRLAVTLDPQAPPAGEPMSLTMKYINAAGDTVFSGGPIEVLAKPGTSGSPQPTVVPIEYVGEGADAKTLSISPESYTGLRLASTSFTATVLDSSDAPLPLAPVAFTSTDSQRVHVNLRTGATTLLGARGTANIIAQTLTGQADTAAVTITPVATSLIVVSGGAQQVRQGEPFPQPIRVRANAIDNIGVAGVVIGFIVQSGQGSVSHMLDTTDLNGDAEVIWTAGDSAGIAVLRAQIYESVVGVNVSGTQLSDAANNLTFGAQPTNITAGNALPGFTIVVRDVTGDTVSSYNSGVTVAISGGTAGASLVGTTTVNALNGVAVFSNLTVDRAGTAYRLIASLPPLPEVPPAQSNTFNVAAAPPAYVSVIAGGGQSAPASTTLPDSIKVRVTDTFGFSVPGVTVTFAISSGGGSVAPASVVTNASGVAAARWTLGAAGAQQLAATVSGISPAIVSATIPAEGGSPVLFLAFDSTGVALGGNRQVPVFLSVPTPSTLTVTLTVRDSTAHWASGSVNIGAGGNAAYPVLVGDYVGSTWAIATSSAGTDSVFVTVDSSVVAIEGFGYIEGSIGDTIRTLVVIKDPAPPGGLTVTVRSTDSAFVLVAPGTGLGAQDDICFFCADLRAAPATTVSLAAAPAGTAILTIPEGAISAQLVILPIDGTGEDTYQLTVEAPGFTGIGSGVFVTLPELTIYLYDGPIGAGQRAEFEVYRDTWVRSDRIVTLRSLDPAVATVDSLAVMRREDSYTEQGVIRGVSAGTAQIVAEMPGAVPDTLVVTVGAARLQANPNDGPSVPLGSRTRLYAYLGYDNGGFFQYGGDADAPITVTYTSRDPGVIRPMLRTRTINEYSSEVSTDLAVVGTGSTWVVIEAPGHIPDSAFYSVVGEAISVSGNTPRLGVGLLDEYFYIQRSFAGLLDSALTLSVVSDNPAVVGVLRPTVSIPANGSSVYGRLEGRSIGTAEITVSGPGVSPVSIIYQVYPTELDFGSYVSNTNVQPDSALRSLSAYLTDGINERHASDTIRAVLRSTDPSILQVQDSIVTFTHNGLSGSGVSFRAIAPGAAQLTLSAYSGPALVPDTSGIITVLPPKVNISAASLSIGRGLQALTSVSRPTKTSVMIPFTVTVQGPAGTSVAAPTDSFPIGDFSRLITVRSGNVLGTDTIIVTAVGHAPDTLFVPVAGTRLSMFDVPGTLQVGVEANGVDLRLRNASTTAVQQVRDTQYVRLISRDTSVLKVLADTLLITPGLSLSQAATIRASAPGKAWLVAQHLNGVSLVDSQQVTVTTPKLYLSDYGPTVMGMQERTYEGQYYLQRSTFAPDSLWVRLESSQPSIVSVPDSVLIPSNGYIAYFEITSGDTTGSAVVTISAPGYGVASIPVFVTRSFLEIWQDDDVMPAGRGTIEIWRETADYGSYPSLVPIPVKVTVADTLVAKMLPDTFTIGTLDYYLDAEWLYGVSPGTTVMTATDERVGIFQRVLPGSGDVYVAHNRLYPGFSDQIHLTVGTSASDYMNFYVDGEIDSLWMQVRSVGGRFAINTDSVLIEGYSSGYFSLRGVSEGLDTLVATAPGFAPETLLVRIGKGILAPPSNLPANLRQGDSTLVTFSILGPNGDFVHAEPSPLTFTLATTAALQVSDGTAPISTRQVEASANYFSFWIKAVAPGGGTLTITHPNFTTFTLNVGTRSP